MDYMTKIFSHTQAVMYKEGKIRESMEGKNPNEIKFDNFGGGSSEQGEQVFKGIAKSVADSHRDFYFKEQKGQQIRNPNYNPLIDDPSEEFLSSSSQAGASSSSQPNNPYSIQNNYVEVRSEGELTPDQLGTIQQVNQELTQVTNVPVNELVPVANGGLAFILGLAGGIR